MGLVLGPHEAVQHEKRRKALPRPAMVRDVQNPGKLDTVGAEANGTFHAKPSPAGRVAELLGRLRAPLRSQALSSRVPAVRGVAVQNIGIRPMLMHAPPRVLPIVENLAAQGMPPDTPDVAVRISLLEKVMANCEIVDVPAPRTRRDS